MVGDELARRIVVYGVTGSGKSTLAAALSTRTGIAWHAVDDLAWEPGWVAVPDDEQRRRIAAICAQDSWILDAAYSRWLDLVLARAQLIVGLDYPRWVSLARLVRRTIARIAQRQAVCNGNVETLRGALGRDSIIAWHFRSFSTRRRRIREWAGGSTTAAVVALTSPRTASRWLSTVGTGGVTVAKQP